VGHRKTEQGDELTEQHSIAHKEGKHEQPYRPPRQPAQAGSAAQEPVERGGDHGADTEGMEPRKGPGE
jgi:hypothetical protein